MSSTLEVIRKSPKEERRDLIISLIPGLREFVSFYNFGDEALVQISLLDKPESKFLIKNGEITVFGEGVNLGSLLKKIYEKRTNFFPKNQQEFLAVLEYISKLPESEKTGKTILIMQCGSKGIFLDCRTRNIRLLLEGTDFTTRASTAFFHAYYPES